MEVYLKAMTAHGTSPCQHMIPLVSCSIKTSKSCITCVSNRIRVFADPASHDIILVLANSTVEIMTQFDEFEVPASLYTA